jgi:hypothetical protein
MRAATVSVGLVSPRSTCESMGALTPLRCARSRSDSDELSRSARTRAPMTLGSTGPSPSASGGRLRACSAAPAVVIQVYVITDSAGQVCASRLAGAISTTIAAVEPQDSCMRGKPDIARVVHPDRAVRARTGAARRRERWPLRGRRWALWRALPAALAAAALCLSGVASAQSPPRWYADGALIAGTVRVGSVHRSELLIQLPRVTLRCDLRIGGDIANPPGGEAGVGELIVSKKSSPVAFCESTSPRGPEGCNPSAYRLRALTRPLHTHLAIEPALAGVRDVMEGVRVALECAVEANAGRFGEVAVITGALKPEVGDSTLEFEGEAVSAQLLKEDSEVWGAEHGPGEVVSATVTGAAELRGRGRGNKTITAA